MTPVCPFVKAARPEDASSRKHPAESENNKPKRDVSDSANTNVISPKCPFGYDDVSDSANTNVISPKCPFGYDSQSFKLGPLSCLVCQALLFECSKCVPCSHVYCKACISRFKDCPLCGADIEKVEADADLQGVVDRFIEGHGRIKRTHLDSEKNEVVCESKAVIYEDVSLERGAFLVQQAMRAFRAQNIGSAKSRLCLCAEDIRAQVETMGYTSDLCSQLGAVLGMLGDCCRATGDSGAAVSYFEESIEFLSKLPSHDLEIDHTLSVSLNKIGDLKYYDGDLQSARSFYSQSLNVRKDAVKHHPDVVSQFTVPSVDKPPIAWARDINRFEGGNAHEVLDVAVSLAKVADVDRNLGNEDLAVNGFQEGIKQLESLSLKPQDNALQLRRQSVLEFLKGQLAEKEQET